MQNKGCITCKKCEQVRLNFYCGRKKLSQKQLYNKYGFCSDYEPKEQIEKPMTEQEYIQSCNHKELTEILFRMIVHGSVIRPDRQYISEWLKQPHTARKQNDN